MPTQEENLIIQSYAAVCLVTELKNNKFLESECFERLIFGYPEIKKIIVDTNVDSQGFFLMAIYAMLVVPHELIEKTYVSEYAIVNDWIKENTQNTNSNYASDNLKINFLRHIRNAVAHAKVSFQPGMSVTFRDEGFNKKTKCNEKFSTDLPLCCAGELINKLGTIHIKYIGNIPPP